MRPWVNIPDLFPTSPYLTRWLHHLDYSIAQRIAGQVFSPDWKWLVRVGTWPMPSLTGQAWELRYHPALETFWVTGREIERHQRQQTRPLPWERRLESSVWPSVYDGWLSRSIECKEYAMGTVQSPPRAGEFTPHTLTPAEVLYFTHGLAARLPWLRMGELRQCLQGVGQQLRAHQGRVPPEAAIWWPVGLALLEQVTHHWPSDWNFWPEADRMAHHQTVLRTLAPHYRGFLPTTLHHLPVSCPLFESVLDSQRIGKNHASSSAPGPALEPSAREGETSPGARSSRPLFQSSLF